MEVLDHLQRNIKLPKSPQRIISLVPSLTELLDDLGLEKRVVGITKYCVHPIHYKATKTIVGGTKKVKVDAIEALKPDFILCSKEENTAEMVEALQQIAPVFVSDVNTFQEALDLILQLGIIFGKRTESQHLVDKILYKHDAFQQYMRQKRMIKSAYFIWKDPWMVAGKPTFIDDMLMLNHMENVFAKKGRYPEINYKNLHLQGNPELLLFSSEPYNFNDEEVYEVLRHNKKVLTIFVDGTYFSWYGSRLLKAFDYFMKVQDKIVDYS